MLKLLRKSLLWLVMLPYAVGLLGAASNQAVLIANGGKFPVMLNAAVQAQVLEARPDGMMDPIHCIMTPDTHLNFLADVFNFQTEIDSIGDLFLELGDASASYCIFLWAVLISMRAARNSCEEK